MKNKAFSLVELSIVLVILGLLTGGILAGQSLIRAAELRSVATELQSYHVAFMSFRDKYFALPGDMRNATDFWDAADATPATCGTTQGTGTQTCDGDGDGFIDILTGSDTGSAEQFRAWQHLANAGLIEGSYTGLNGSVGNNNDINIGVNAPASKVGNAGWGIRWGSGAGSSLSFARSQGNVFTVGADAGTTGGVRSAAFTPEEVWNIDTKLDDGRPGLGKIMAAIWDDCTDAATNGSANDDEINANYLLTDTSILCAIDIISSF